jgi:SAM-dependent MidA family methyltransferase
MRKEGFITFARFMDLALYCPVYGYYEKEKDTSGRRGDFFTNVSVGELFGELLAFQFWEWLSTLDPQPPTLNVVEAGAHDGQLAKDILLWLRAHRQASFAQVIYYIIEPSARRRKWQRKTLFEFGDKVRWAAHWEDLNDAFEGAGIPGIIFSNELLDAMPVHRLGWDAMNKNWFEWGVALRDEQFVWVKIRNPECRILKPKLSAELLEILPDGFATEICPSAEAWWREAARMLQRGKLLTIDYGLTAEEFFAPERSEGSLRAYHRHYLRKDLLANTGEQDITAHINFTAIQTAGEAAGLRTEAFICQENFLTQVAERVWKEETHSGVWTPDHTRQFQTLTHPQHLGRKFHVLIQSRS